MGVITTKGIILRSADFGEANRVLTVFTEDKGIVSVGAYGARSKRSKFGKLCRVLVYGNITLDEQKRRITDIEPIESFFPLSEDIERLSLAMYMCELVRLLIIDEVAAPELLRLLLNTLHLLCDKKRNPMLLKAVFELRAMALEGYAPEHENCVLCGASGEMGGFYTLGTVCKDCVGKNGSRPLQKGTLNALRFILTSDEKRIFSFEASDVVASELSAISESHVLQTLGKTPKTLEYFKKL